MRLVALILLCIAFCCPLARADRDVIVPYIFDPIWITSPPQASLPASYALSDYRSSIGLICAIHAGGLSACHPVEDPQPPDFLQAAIQAMAGARIEENDAGGRPTEGHELFVIEEFPPPREQAATGTFPPEAPQSGVYWLERPTTAVQYMPRAAARQHVSGAVSLECLVTSDSRVLCTVISETPLHYGFGDAAMLMAHNFKLGAQLPDGRPTIGGRVRVNLNFNAPH